MSGHGAVQRALTSALALMLGVVGLVGVVGVVGVGSVVVAGPAAAAAPLHGIDVSNWQGTVDWGAVRRSGRVFGFAKATEGASLVDNSFFANRGGMASSGMVLRGLYHFARPDRNTAAAEAGHFLRTVGPLTVGEVPVLDLEVAAGPGLGDWAAEWLAAVGQATGRTPILYSNESYLDAIPTSRLTGYPLWVASWGVDNGRIPATLPRTDRWPVWTWWQYTSKARVPGVNGQVDDSIFAGTAADLAGYGNTRTPAAPDPVGDLLRGLLGPLLTPAPKP